MAPLMLQALSPDVLGDVFQLLDVRDLLLTTVAAAPSQVPLHQQLPHGWTFEAQRPLTEPEAHGLAGVGIPVRLWPTCPIRPHGLLLIWRAVKEETGGTDDVYEDHRGVLFLDRHMGTPNTPNRWTVIDEHQFQYLKCRNYWNHWSRDNLRVWVDRELERRFAPWRKEEILEVWTSPPLLLMNE